MSTEHLCHCPNKNQKEDYYYKPGCLGLTLASPNGRKKKQNRVATTRFDCKFQFEPFQQEISFFSASHGLRATWSSSILDLTP